MNQLWYNDKVTENQSTFYLGSALRERHMLDASFYVLFTLFNHLYLLI